jgi:kynurenine formamidase
MTLQTRTPATVEEFLAYKERFKNWGRWGEDDQLGTLNFITREVRRKAAGLVREGRSISCANPIQTRAVQPDEHRNSNPADHRMRVSGTGSGDYIGLSFHGFVNTHIDALCHRFTEADGVMYNGKPISLVTEEGALSHSIDRWNDGIVTRGVLYDIPRMRGTDYVSLDRPVEGWDLEDFAHEHGVEPRPGDAVLIRSGDSPFWAANPGFVFTGPRDGLSTPGVAVSALEFLYEHDAAILVWDLQEAGNHGMPATVPLHEVAIPYMGMTFVDNANLERLADACAAVGRYEFLFTVAPLVVIGGTGSPVNPIATL